MGGDLGPAEVIEAVKLTLTSGEDIDPIVLVGDQAVLEPLARAKLAWRDTPAFPSPTPPR